MILGAETRLHAPKLHFTEEHSVAKHWLSAPVFVARKINLPGEEYPELPAVHQNGDLVYDMKSELPAVHQNGVRVYDMKSELLAVHQNGALVYDMESELPAVHQNGDLVYDMESELPAVHQNGALVYIGYRHRPKMPQPTNIPFCCSRWFDKKSIVSAP